LDKNYNDSSNDMRNLIEDIKEILEEWHKLINQKIVLFVWN
jgi:hypothetical protein